MANQNKLFINYLFLLFSFAFFGQNNEMVSNNNRFDYEFKAKNKLKKEFIKNENPENKIQIIAKVSNDTIISIYLKNNSKDSLNISYQDSRLYLIQEAKNQNGEWKPIEYWSYSWCGNSYYSENIGSGKIIKTDTKKYNGNFETDIRFKFLINNQTYYSNSLKSTIDILQFNISNEFTEHSTYKRAIRVADNNLAEKVMFLEPDAMKEYSEKMKEWRESIIQKINENNKTD
ncbi:hypothetical protein [Flavobacterium urocaniciphilum]|uniref:Uncharacterized protein n=1 Tax=Flavobacterium urocaniciphilum TaxID=1299341 RepID=A0A1H8YST2_9FLAO|nr:hypothetical protein [Flavobacterium urocaniciphilum]SEP55197.1 hypothetical protein SAMN05444005_101151 [Flavobacterium urocaniciphilum]